ncbi:hypothetical protein ACFVZH_22365 [Streptomyces sp. NPDC059534]|uniref:hypothetical protein n=1 Tax=Streptomyces sp. NPDC059534 TaxID=3346859 RepID=UPI00369A0A73
MPTFPTPDLSGSAYQLHVGTPNGPAAIIVSLPGDPDISREPGVEDAIRDFGEALAALVGGPLFSISCSRTSRTDLSVAP